MLYPTIDSELLRNVINILDSCLRVGVKILHNIKEVWMAAKLEQYRKKILLYLLNRKLCKVNVSDIQRHVLFFALLLQLSHRENQVNGGALRS